VAGGQLGLPVFVRARIAPAEDASELFVGPGIEVDRLDSADMRAHATVDARTPDADKDAEVPTSPSRVLVLLAVGAYFVALQLQEALDCQLVLGRSFSSGVWRWSSRHRGFCLCVQGEG